MPRLPIPGSDNGVWGQVLNDFLGVELDANGNLKIRTDGTLANLLHTTGAESVTGVKTFTVSPIVPTPASNDDAANKAYVDSVASSGAPDATTTTKGLVQLAGDLGGTGTAAAAPVISDGAITDAKVNAAAGIAKSKLAPLNIVDADVSAISQSKITDLTTDLSGKMALAGGNNPVITNNALTNGFARIDLNYTPNGSTPDAFAFYHNGVRTGYHNEKGELRARAAADNSVPFRVQQRSLGQSVNLTEWTQSDNTVLASVGPTGIISAPNVDRKVSYGASEPTSPSLGDLWIQP